MHAEEGGMRNRKMRLVKGKNGGDNKKRDRPNGNQLKGGSGGQSGDKQDRSCEHPAHCHQPPK